MSISAFKDRFLSKRKLLHSWKHLCWNVKGLAHDFWKDGDGKKYEGGEERVKKEDAKKTASANVAVPAAAEAPRKPKENRWHAMPGEVSEKMWGEGYVTPGDIEVTNRLIRPLGINKDMSLLDLSAGLGGRLRKTTDDYGVYINGLEPDPEIARRGMEMSKAAGRAKRVVITAYDPLKLTADRLYDCIIARETIYRVTEKEKFIKSIVACCKPKAQVSFTDYIVDPEMRDKPAIVAWRAFEKGADPLGLVQMAEIWAKAGFNLRVHDDMSDFYKKEVMAGLARFAKFMASGGPKPDDETKKAIDKRITTWAHRMAAMEQGMKLYRFYGLR